MGARPALRDRRRGGVYGRRLRPHRHRRRHRLQGNSQILTVATLPEPKRKQTSKIWVLGYY